MSHRIRDILDAIQIALDNLMDRVADLEARFCELTRVRSLNGYVSAVKGRGCNNVAANIPVPSLLDVEKILLSVMPRKADGHVDAAAVISWASSDESQVGIEPGTESFVFHDPQFDEDVTCPGAFNCYALTPLESGSATVTASAAGYESAEFGPITYAPGQPRSLNASVGSPVSDL